MAAGTIRPCEKEWTAEKAKGVRELVERLSGQACPCDRGLVCPLLPGVQAGLREAERDTDAA